MLDCRRCKHPFEKHTGTCPCAPGKLFCEWNDGVNGCVCCEYKEKFNGEEDNNDQAI